MVQIVDPSHIITIEIQHYDGSNGIPNCQGPESYTAWIKEPKYRGIIVQAGSIDECLKELSISLKVLEHYRKNEI